jgi:hypothetical protein
VVVRRRKTKEVGFFAAGRSEYQPTLRICDQTRNLAAVSLYNIGRPVAQITVINPMSILGQTTSIGLTG